jgi:hypothetical protein
MIDDMLDAARYGEYDRTGINAPLINILIYTEKFGYRVVMDVGDGGDARDIHGSADTILDAIRLALLQRRLTT